MIKTPFIASNVAAPFVHPAGMRSAPTPKKKAVQACPFGGWVSSGRGGGKKTGHCWATPADPRPGGSSSFIEEWSCPAPQIVNAAPSCPPMHKKIMLSRPKTIAEPLGAVSGQFLFLTLKYFDDEQYILTPCHGVKHFELSVTILITTPCVYRSTLVYGVRCSYQWFLLFVSNWIFCTTGKELPSKHMFKKESLPTWKIEISYLAFPPLTADNYWHT